MAELERARARLGRVTRGWLEETKRRMDEALAVRETNTALVTGLLSWSDKAKREPSTAVMRRVSSTCLGGLPVYAG